MCRLFTYKGYSVSLDELLVKPSNSLVYQCGGAGRGHSLIPGLPDSLHMPKNIDGSGIAWYDEVGTLKRYRSSLPACFDQTLLILMNGLRSGLVFGHVRSASAGVTGESAAEVEDFNCHPFVYGNIVFMHNGAISGFGHIRSQLESFISPDSTYIVEGKTDSELCFALFLSQLKTSSILSSDDLSDALDRTITLITYISKRNSIKFPSSLNFAVSNGVHIVVSRFRNSENEFEQPPSLYIHKTSGIDPLRDLETIKSVMISSEPISAQNLDQWYLVPKNSMVIVSGLAEDSSVIESIKCRPIFANVFLEDSLLFKSAVTWDQTKCRVMQ